ncbi:MAG: DUF222 domain-containing protein [Acidimicrobiales bacterium]|nr:DUF222 domain-containing protein [Acidimicrobiales bacterium]
MFTAIHATLAGVTATNKTRNDLESLIAALARVESHAAERRLAMLAAIDDLDDGGLSGEDTDRVKARRSKKKAKRNARTASKLKDMPKTRTALANGEITTEHADAAADAAERVSPEEADELADDAASRPADLFGRQARSWASARERESAKQDRAKRQRDAREASWWVDADGMWNLFAKLDPDTGRELQKILNKTVDGLWRDDGGRDGRPDELRTPPQRKADALTRLIREPRSATGGPSRRRPHPKHLIGIRVDHTRLRGDDPAGTAEYVDGSPIPQTTLERLVCDAAFVGFVFDQNGETLFQGRATRLATDAQWANLIVRDGGCFCCNSAPEHCTAHHLVPYAPPARGPTDIDHLVLVCTRTHHLIHDHGYRVIRGPDGVWQLHPPNAGSGEAEPSAA